MAIQHQTARQSLPQGLTVGRRSLTYNTLIQVVGRVVGLVISLITLNFVANHLIVANSLLQGYGQYTIVFTYITFITAVADLGLFTLLVRELVSSSKQASEDLISRALGFRLVLIAIAYLLLGLVYQFLPYAHVVNQSILIGLLIALAMLTSQVIASIFQTHMATDKLVISETVGRLIILAMTVFVLKSGYGLIGVVEASLIGNIVTFLVGVLFARQYLKIGIRFDFAKLRHLHRDFWTIGLVSLLGLIYFKVDSLILTFYQNENAIALYGVAYRILDVIIILPSIFSANLMPVLTGLFDTDQSAAASQLVRRSGTIVLTVALGITITVFSLAPWLIVFIARTDYLEAAVPLRILSLALALVFLATLMSGIVISARHQERLIGAYLLVVVINIVTNFYAIPHYSYLGAAVTTVLSSLVLAIYTTAMVHKLLGSSVNWSVLYRLIWASVLTGLAIYFGIEKLLIPASHFAQLSKLGQAGYLFLAGSSCLGLFALFVSLLARNQLSQTGSLLKRTG